MSERPNLVYIFTDQQSADAMSCAGNPYVRTPALDSLAQRGVRFERAYSAYPLCTPARASMFTGRMPHEIGITQNGQHMTDEARLQGIGHVLSAAGYECVYGGKWHVPEIALPDDDSHGFRRICGFDDNLLPVRCAEFIKGEHERPFFLVASFDNPHNICEWGRQQALPWGPIPDVPPLDDCPNLPANYGVPPYEPVMIRIRQRMNPIYSFTLDQSPADWRRYRFGYYRLVEMVDRQIGLILDALEESGLDENTVIVFSADHGDMCGSHQLIQKSVLYDESVRVPMLVSGLGARPRGLVDDAHLVSSGLDLFPTLCDYAGVKAPEGLEGRSLRPVAQGEIIPDWRDHVVAETRLDPVNLGGRMVRTDRYKYVAYERGRHLEQLFDMIADPGEQVNLAVESRCREVLDQHRRLLGEWCERTGDTFGRHYSHPDVPFMVPGHEYE